MLENDSEGLDRARAKLSLSEDALLEELAASIEGSEAIDLRQVSPEVLRQRALQWLDVHRASLRHKICIEWNYKEKIKDPRYQDMLFLTAALADLMGGMLKEASPFTVAAFLVKRGVEKLCT